MPMASVPRRVSVNDSRIVHEAPMADSENPEAGRETRVLEQGPGSFDRIAYLSLAIAIGLMSPWRSFAMWDTHVSHALISSGAESDQTNASAGTVLPKNSMNAPYASSADLEGNGNTSMYPEYLSTMTRASLSPVRPAAASLIEMMWSAFTRSPNFLTALRVFRRSLLAGFRESVARVQLIQYLLFGQCTSMCQVLTASALRSRRWSSDESSRLKPSSSESKGSGTGGTSDSSLLAELVPMAWSPEELLADGLLDSS